MGAAISLAVDDPVELESLYSWLRRERDLAGRVKLAGSAPRAGELGAAAEALIVAVGSGGAVSVLAGSLKAWVSLPRRSDVHIQVRGTGGRAIEITAKRIQEERVDDLLRQVLDSELPEE
jgi:hypothetical protein